jgi:hypothetical protein
MSNNNILPELNSKPSKKLILLIHGIRTQAEWHEMVIPILKEKGTTVVPIKYGYFNAFSFWFPFFTRRGPIDEILWKIEDAIDNYADQDTELLIIAHSFGTYAISQILKEKPTIRPKRMILCGSIIAENFHWDRLPNRPEIINECGSRDIWPILAKSTTWGYGNSGVFGFGVPKVKDRFHNFGHSDYFTQEFVKQFWYPWIYESRVVTSEYESKRPVSPWWRSILSILPINWLIVIIIFFLIFIASFKLLNSPDIPPPELYQDDTGCFHGVLWTYKKGELGHAKIFGPSSTPCSISLVDTDRHLDDIRYGCLNGELWRYLNGDLELSTDKKGELRQIKNYAKIRERSASATQCRFSSLRVDTDTDLSLNNRVIDRTSNILK